MLRRFGLSTRLILVSLFVLSSAVTAGFYLSRTAYRRALETESTAHARTIVDSLVALVSNYGLPGDDDRMRADIGAVTATERQARLRSAEEDAEAGARLVAQAFAAVIARQDAAVGIDMVRAEAFAISLDQRRREIERMTAEFEVRDRATVDRLIDMLSRYGAPTGVDRLREGVVDAAVFGGADFAPAAIAGLALYSVSDDRLWIIARARRFRGDLAPSALDRRAAETDDFVTERIGRDGTPHLAAARTFKHAGGEYLLHVEISLLAEDVAEDELSDGLVWVLAVSSAVLAAFVLLIVRFTVSRPIGLLERTMADARRVGLGRILPVYGDDQFGDLIRTYNEMSLDLKAAAERNRGLMKELQVFNRELEVRVDEAVRDLRSKNSELIQTQERLHTVQQDVSRLERLASLGQLSSMLAHELSTPLNVVLGHLEILEREVKEFPAPKARVATLMQQVTRLVGILREMLSAVRMPDPRPTPVGFCTLVEDTLRFMTPSTEARRIVVRSDLPAGETLVLVDRHQAQQVILNVITNAIDATPDGSTLWVSVDQPDERSVRLRVRDSGPGISVEELKRIFEPFFTTKDRHKGVGLGLAISMDIMKKNGGTLAASNHPDGGAVFEMTFRRYEPQGGMNRGDDIHR